jgi:hypothetical protein
LVPRACSERSNAARPVAFIAAMRSSIVGIDVGIAANCWAKPRASAMACHSRRSHVVTPIVERRSKSLATSASALMSSP